MSIRRCLPLILAAAIPSTLLAATSVEQTQAPLEQSHSRAAEVQAQIDQLDAQARDDALEYAALQRRADQLEAYNAAMKTQVASQQTLLLDLQTQLASLADTEQSVLPLLTQMQGMLEKVVAADTPFLLDERKERLERLEDTLSRADVSVAEKYRQLLSAYQVEADYGRALEAYNGPLEHNGQTREVTYLRLGRLALYYQSLDGLESGLWQAQQATWQPLAAEHNLTLQNAIAMARQQAIPQLLSLPLPHSPREAAE